MWPSAAAMELETVGDWEATFVTFVEEEERDGREGIKKNFKEEGVELGLIISYGTGVN